MSGELQSLFKLHGSARADRCELVQPGAATSPALPKKTAAVTRRIQFFDDIVMPTLRRRAPRARRIRERVFSAAGQANRLDGRVGGAGASRRDRCESAGVL